MANRELPPKWWLYFYLLLAISQFAGQAAALLDEPHDCLEALPDAQIAEHEWTRAAHALGVALHDIERGADMRRKVDLVDDQEVGAGNARSAFGRNFVAGRHVDHIDGEVGQLGRERRRQIVAAG